MTAERRAALVTSLVVLVLAVAGIVALWPRGPAPSQASASSGPASVNADGGAGLDDAQLAGARAATALAPCPSPTGRAPAGPLAGITVPCLGAAGSVDLGAALAGRATLVNVWASWCGPCRTELPALAEYAARPGAVPVLGLDVRDDPRAALALLGDLGVHLPSVTDPEGTVRTALALPPGLPISYLVHADGSTARVDPPVPFTSADAVAAAVARLS